MPRGSKLKVLHVNQEKNMELVADAFWEVMPQVGKDAKNQKYRLFKESFVKNNLLFGVSGKSAKETSDVFNLFVSTRLRTLTRLEILAYLVDDLFSSLNLSEAQKLLVLAM
jgi:hypothetical protein